MGVAFRTSIVVIYLATWIGLPAIAAEPLVPGSGVRVEQVGDDFEDPDWHYHANRPKSSSNLDDQENGPTGVSENDRWYEGAKRGHPDIVRRVATPAGGPHGSRGALLLRSRQTGLPGRPSNQTQQDDFICDIHSRIGGQIPASYQPNCVVRVFFPPIAHWEKRSGAHFALRISCTPANGSETYYPGMIIHFRPKADTQLEYDHAYIAVRANAEGDDFKAAQLTQTGWWTLGMSVTADGKIHYYARPGVERLTAEDRIASAYPYGDRAARFANLFFNVLSADDGQSWSTPIIIDDAQMFVVPPRER